MTSNGKTGGLGSVQLTYNSCTLSGKTEQEHIRCRFQLFCCLRRIGKQVKILCELVTVIGECSCVRLRKSSHWETGKAADESGPDLIL